MEGHRVFNPGWHLAIDLRNMLLVSECIAKAADAHREPLRPHPRRPPGDGIGLAQDLLVCRTEGDSVVPDLSVTKQDQIPVRQDLLDLFELSELEKYFTDGELVEHPERSK